MSGKNKKKKTKVSRKSEKGWIILALITIILIGAVVFIFLEGDHTPEETTSQMVDREIVPVVETETMIETKPEQDFLFYLGNDIGIIDIASYDGAYLEDGTDEEVSNVLMIEVMNTGDDALQYAEITLAGETEEAIFKLSTLMPGDTAMVLEANRKEYTSVEDYTMVSVENMAFFQQNVSLQENQLKVQPLDGGFNITNISDADIHGEIVIYFKNYIDGIYYGGITYRGRISEGLKAGEIKQIMSENFSKSETKVVFITIEGQE